MKVRGMENREKTNSAVVGSADYDLLLAEESFILDAQMTIQRLLNEKGLTQTELARRLGVGDSYISQMLGDSARNLTLRTVARIMVALDETPHLTTCRNWEQLFGCVQHYQYDADFGPWGEVTVKETRLDQPSVEWSASEWAANENHVA